MPAYKTLKREGSAEVVITKSRFIGQCRPCHTEEEALAFLEAVRAAHRDARHNCYAYIIGANMGVMRYSDDGEPGGTAGLPIIETMKSRGVTDACVVVTRYFGGVLLGTGGLTRAYRQGCRIALDAGGVVEMIPSLLFLCEVAYPLWDRLNYALEALPVEKTDVSFDAAVQATLKVRLADAERVKDEITRLCQGRAEFLDVEEKEMPWDEKEHGGEE